jgi:hypothetical protein
MACEVQIMCRKFGIDEVCRLRGHKLSCLFIIIIPKIYIILFLSFVCSFHLFVSVCGAAELVLAEHVQDDQAEEGEDQEREENDIALRPDIPGSLIHSSSVGNIIYHRDHRLGCFIIKIKAENGSSVF